MARGAGPETLPQTWVRGGRFEALSCAVSNATYNVWHVDLPPRYFSNLYVTPQNSDANAWGIGWWVLHHWPSPQKIVSQFGCIAMCIPSAPHRCTKKARRARSWVICLLCRYTPNTRSSKFYNNTLVSFQPTASRFHYVWSLPEPSLDFEVFNNSYFTPACKALTFTVAGPGTMGPKPAFPPSSITTLAQWQKLISNDVGSTISADMGLDRLVGIAKRMLQL